MRFKTVVLVSSLMLFLFACSEEKKKEKVAPPPPEISVIETRAEDVPIFLEFVGQTHGLKDITIRARVEGFLEGPDFEAGIQGEDDFSDFRQNAGGIVHGHQA